MNTLRATLTTSDNSAAVRLPKDLLRMSGLSQKVQLEARRGKIVISNLPNAREGWSDQIKVLVSVHGDPTHEFEHVQAGDDGLDDLAWDGPTFDDSQKNHAELS